MCICADTRMHTLKKTHTHIHAQEMEKAREREDKKAREKRENFLEIERQRQLLQQQQQQVDTNVYFQKKEIQIIYYVSLYIYFTCKTKKIPTIWISFLFQFIFHMPKPKYSNHMDFMSASIYTFHMQDQIYSSHVDCMSACIYISYATIKIKSYVFQVCFLMYSIYICT